MTAAAGAGKALGEKLYGTANVVLNGGGTSTSPSKVNFMLDENGNFSCTADDALGAASNTTNKIPWGSWSDYEKVTVNGQEYAKVGDRLYSHHAVDRMQPSGNRYGSSIYQAGGDYGRSVAPQYVEDVINSTKPIIQENGNLSYASGSLQVITNQQGAVVTIITK